MYKIGIWNLSHIFTDLLRNNGGRSRRPKKLIPTYKFIDQSSKLVPKNPANNMVITWSKKFMCLKKKAQDNDSIYYCNVAFLPTSLNFKLLPSIRKILFSAVNYRYCKRRVEKTKKHKGVALSKNSPALVRYASQRYSIHSYHYLYQVREPLNSIDKF